MFSLYVKAMSGKNNAGHLTIVDSNDSMIVKSVFGRKLIVLSQFFQVYKNQG